MTTQAERWCELHRLDGGDDIWTVLGQYAMGAKEHAEDGPTWTGEHMETAEFVGEVEASRVYAAARWQDGSGIIWWGDVWDTVTPDGDFACGLVISWEDRS